MSDHLEGLESGHLFEGWVLIRRGVCVIKANDYSIFLFEREHIRG